MVSLTRHLHIATDHLHLFWSCQTFCPKRNHQIKARVDSRPHIFPPKGSPLTITSHWPWHCFSASWSFWSFSSGTIRPQLSRALAERKSSKLKAFWRVFLPQRVTSLQSIILVVQWFLPLLAMLRGFIMFLLHNDERRVNKLHGK